MYKVVFRFHLSIHPTNHKAQSVGLITIQKSKMKKTIFVLLSKTRIIYMETSDALTPIHRIINDNSKRIGRRHMGHTIS